MASSTRQAIACIIVIIGAAVFARAQSVPVKEATSSISGKVTVKGKGAPGIVVGLRSNEQSYRPQSVTYRAVTDADGEYRIANVPAGNYQLMAVAPAFVSPEIFGSKSLIVDKGETIEHVDFSLVRGGVITGKVLDSDGRPAIEEEVFAVPSQLGERSYNVPTARTDDRGVYRIFGMAAGSYKVAAGRDESSFFPEQSRAAYKRTYHPSVVDLAQATVIEVTEGSEATNIDITLSRPLTTYSASGRVVDSETGQPLPNLGYGLTYFADSNSTSSWNNGAVTNARGEFSYRALLPGKYEVALRPGPNTDWRVEPLRFEVIDQNVTGLVVKAKRGASISGVVVLEGTDDKAVREQLSRSGLTASIAGAASERSWFNGMSLSRDGSFHMGGLQSGVATFVFPSGSRFRVARVEHEGVIQSRGIELKEGQQISGVRVVINYGNASIRGVIELENGVRPENGRFFVNVRKREEDGRNTHISETSAQVDARGQFVMEGLMPGDYEVQAGLYIPGPKPTVIDKTQALIVTAGAATNIVVKLDLNGARP
jgi:protocatechuate 3,4-dioxygenase beta subunit